jgi:16S rRNA G527 N7-methylase RsmG
MLPENDFTLLDGTRKKVDCVREFADSLELKNVTTQWGRAEDMRSPMMKEERLHNKNGIVYMDGTPTTSDHFDLVVTRAAAYIEDLFTWIKPLLKAEGRAWIYKQASEEEWADGQQLAKNRGMILTKVLTYHLADQERWILEIRKK